MTDTGIRGPLHGRAEEVLMGDAVQFLVDLHRRFEPTRRQLLANRQARQAALDRGEMPDFLPGTEEIRKGDWQVAEAPPDLRDRRVEITGPTDRKMMINGLNSGARVFMADFEDANSPSWVNMVEGQVNLIDAVRGVMTHVEEAKTYELASDTATLVVRPRGWHLEEPHLLVGGDPIAASLFDAGLYMFHNARELLERGSGPYFYLPKLENHLEARLWNEVFVYAQECLAIPQGSVRATVLIETITAAFEMEEILHELRNHSGGLNAGRWDYVFSIIKKFRAHPNFILPDRAQVTMEVSFMRAYAEALVRACHRRGAHAIGGMSAFIPSRRNPEVNRKALPKVSEDKHRECTQGFDGAWVAHPDLVPLVTEVFDQTLGDRPNQVERQREDVNVCASDLLDVSVHDGQITDDGLRTNVSVGILYLDSWLRGSGAAALSNLMEDTATAEISRSQIWQWLHHEVSITNGPTIQRHLVTKVIEDELQEIRTVYAEQESSSRLSEARRLFEHVALSDEFIEFLTLPGMSYLY